MSKEIYISSTPHETRLAIVEDDALTEMYYERENEYTLAGSIYNGRVTRVLPGMQSSFVDIGLERDAFLYITDFMEEAGDTADFEATHGGSGEARGPRTDSTRGSRSERGERGERPAPAVIEGSLAAPDAQREGGRSEEGRGERGGRNRRGRGDRDRHGRSEGNGRPNGNVAAGENNGTSEAGFSPAEAMRPVEGSGVEGVGFETSSVGEIGEGAPGADGSRRWRGRRGRRRGRGQTGNNAEPGAVPQTGLGDTTETDAMAGTGESDTPFSYNADEFAKYSHEIDGAAAGPDDAATPFVAAVHDAVSTNRGPSTGDSGREPGQDRNGDRDRNRGRNRGRDRGRDGRGDRGGRDGGRDAQSPGAARGFASSREGYGQAPANSEDETTVEPIILPGESLSKYRRDREAESTASSSTASFSGTVIPLVPSTVVENTLLVAGWDGGSVLPGETLSRRNRAEVSSASPQGQRSDRGESRREGSSDRSSGRGSRDRDRADGRGRGQNRYTETPGSQPEESRSLDEDRNHRSAALTPPPHSDAHEQLPQQAHATHPEAIETEYEPQDASASYRIDPVAPSEFRQASPSFEEVTGEDEEVELQAPQQVHQPSDGPGFAAAEPATQALDTTGVPPPPFFHAEPQEESPIEPAGADLTTISATGEMHSAPVTATTEGAEFASDENGDAAAHAEEHISDRIAIHAAHDQRHAEIEELDEESDEIEQETLEGAADLGTMLREMSIDQMTRPGDLEETEEEEDFEEEEAEFTSDLDGGLSPEDEDDAADDFEESEESDTDKPGHQTEADAAFFADAFREPSAGSETGSGERSEQSQTNGRPDRQGRGEGRRGGRNGRRDGRSDSRSDSRGGSGERSRSTGGEHERPRTSGRSRQSAQMTNLPAISDLLKPGQEILVQIAKEPIAKKGARITSHIALPGRFLVFMPTVNHTGVSRKIESDHERRRLKEILLSEKGDASGGFIVRTAAAGASEEELRSDLRFLLNLWADIKTRSESSKSPALIYHDLNLVERILRDQVTDNFSAIWVDTESEYERVLRFLQRFQPALIRRVKLYTKETPLFEQFGITEEINKALRSKVWLKSGGSIVINQTEALVAIDINTGKFVGKTARLEDTIVKTNLDAIPEIVRQIRLRDLGGIIIIDFIDMDERKNRNRVMAALEEELKSDRAPSKVLQFNDFGLVAITRKRVKQSLERTLSTTCGVCQGTGMVKSPITVCNDIYIEMRKMHKHLDRGDVMLRVHPEVVKQLKSGTSKWLQEMEEMVGKTILVKSDPSLHPEQFDIH